MGTMALSMKRTRSKSEVMSEALLRTVLCGGLGAAFAFAMPEAQARDDWSKDLSGFGVSSDDARPSIQERRERSRRIRDELVARLGPEYQTTAPLTAPSTAAAMQAAIERYRAIVARGGWRSIPKGTLRPGDGSEAVALLRHRLWLSGDLRKRARRDWKFDAGLEDAVARFQIRHGLKVSGFMDRRTWHALNVPADARLRQLQTNLARLNDLAQVNKAKRFVMVNVPSYELQAVEDGNLALSSRVVVGKPTRQTPSISARIVELNFFPYWRVPDSIAHRDLIPQLQKDPDYFFREKFSILKTWGTKPMDPSQVDWSAPVTKTYKFRQDPGPQNALGVVRINMPNKHIVYLHDTPLKELFGRSSRAFSSGCVRVERVLDLASWLLKERGDWSPLRVQTAVALGNSETVKLKKAVPVHFVYVTAWAGGNGTAHFRNDIYGRDGASSLVAQIQDKDAPEGARAITP